MNIARGFMYFVYRHSDLGNMQLSVEISKALLAGRLNQSQWFALSGAIYSLEGSIDVPNGRYV